VKVCLFVFCVCVHVCMCVCFFVYVSVCLCLCHFFFSTSNPPVSKLCLTPQSNSPLQFTFCFSQPYITHHIELTSHFPAHIILLLSLLGICISSAKSCARFLHKGIKQLTNINNRDQSCFHLFQSNVFYLPQFWLQCFFTSVCYFFQTSVHRTFTFPNSDPSHAKFLHIEIHEIYLSPSECPFQCFQLRNLTF